MSLKVIPSFTSGELDPALHERTNFDKYKAGLSTARNVIIGKTGRVLSRPGRKWLVQCKTSSRKVLIHGSPDKGTFLEWGHLYVRIYTLDGTLLVEKAHALTEDDLPNIRFVDINAGFTLIFLKGSSVLQLVNAGDLTAFITTYFDRVPAPDTIGVTAVGTPTGRYVDYVATAVVSRVESVEIEILGASTRKLPITASQSNTINVTVTSSWGLRDKYNEFKIYRRPQGGGAYGYIGSTTTYTNSSGDLVASFSDFGQAADYSHSPPTFTDSILDAGSTDTVQDLVPSAGLLYQQRLLLVSGETITTSRTGKTESFLREYPLSDDSALDFKTGSSGFAEILHVIDSDGLVVFTTKGVFLQTGGLSPTNITLVKKGNWVIDKLVPPIAVPGGVLFIDSLTNTVRRLFWSAELSSYIGEELSIFSNHLFQSSKVVSWAFEEGEFPLLWIVFSDGTMSSFTYEPEHKMKAWTRHDSVGLIESVTYMRQGFVNINFPALGTIPGRLIVVSNHNGVRHIETSVPRYLSATIAEADTESDKNETIAAMDSMVSWSHLVNDDKITVLTEALTATFVDGDVTTGTDTINITAHGFSDLDRIQLTTTGVLPAGLALTTDYWVIGVDNDNFKLASTRGNGLLHKGAASAGAVDITAAAGGGTHTVTRQTASNALTVAQYTSNFTDGDVTTGTDNINITAHGLVDLKKVQILTSGVLPTGLALLTDYWVIRVDADNYKLASTLANATADIAVDITAAAGGGTHTTISQWDSFLQVTSDVDFLFSTGVASTFVDGGVDTTQNEITSTAHGLVDGTLIQLTSSGTLPGGLALATDYYVMRLDADTYRLSTTKYNAISGARISITSAGGGGTHTATPVVAMGTVGTVLRYFDSDKVSFDLTVLSFTDGKTLIVEPDVTFPSTDGTDPKLYEAKGTFTGLAHMDGESVSIVSDGFVLASPNNSKENYTAATPSGGSLTLSSSQKGAFVHIGRPYVSDVETLDIDTVEQRPVLIESMTVNKIYIKTYKSRGFYIASRFPVNDTLDGLDITDMQNVDMGDISLLDVDYEAANPIIGNRYDQPVTKRVEQTMAGDWKSQGKVCVRNVDPIHFEILSFMPDLEDMRRSNRKGDV